MMERHCRSVIFGIGNDVADHKVIHRRLQDSTSQNRKCSPVDGTGKEYESVIGFSPRLCKKPQIEITRDLEHSAKNISIV